MTDLARHYVAINNAAAAGTVATADLYYAGQQLLETSIAFRPRPSTVRLRLSSNTFGSACYVDSPIETDRTVSTYSTAAGGGSWICRRPT